MNIIDNREKNRFEAEIDGHQAVVEYSVKPGILVLKHIEVDKELAGKGIGGEMAESVLLEMELRGLKVIAECPFIKKYIEKHPEWNSILVKE